MQPGTKIKILFNTQTWPVASGVYTYEGHDEVGYWVRRKDGVQRHFEYGDVVEVIPLATGAIPEGSETENY